jgi:hypothetical protein
MMKAVDGRLPLILNMTRVRRLGVSNDRMLEDSEVWGAATDLPCLHRFAAQSTESGRKRGGWWMLPGPPSCWRFKALSASMLK